MLGKLLVLVVLAAGMGLAIQRGGTCTVAAVEEIVTQRRISQLRAMLLAALWVAGLITLARAAGWSMVEPGGYRVTALTIVGGALLGLGAWINGACAFGSVARLGTGGWAYLATPLGFGLGALMLPKLFAIAPPSRLEGHSQLLDFPIAWASALAVVAIWLLLSLWRARKARTWTPAVATLVIGLCFVMILLLTGGAWTWTDTVSELARGMGVAGGTLRLILIVALFGGAIASSIVAGSFKHQRLRAATVLRCFVGGLLMAAGSQLIPGSNDSLLLEGLPLFWPFAWLAFLSMCVTIALAIRITQVRG